MSRPNIHMSVTDLTHAQMKRRLRLVEMPDVTEEKPDTFPIWLVVAGIVWTFCLLAALMVGNP